MSGDRHFQDLSAVRHKMGAVGEYLDALTGLQSIVSQRQAVAQMMKAAEESVRLAAAECAAIRRKFIDANLEARVQLAEANMRLLVSDPVEDPDISAFVLQRADWDHIVGNLDDVARDGIPSDRPIWGGSVPPAESEKSDDV